MLQAKDSWFNRNTGMGEKISIRARAQAFDPMEPPTRTGTAGVVRLDHRPEVFPARDALKTFPLSPVTISVSSFIRSPLD